MNVTLKQVRTLRRRSRSWASIGTGAVVLLFSGLINVNLASASPSLVGSVHLSQTAISPGGAQIEVTAASSVDANCSVSISPAISSMPSATACDANWPVQFTLHVPGNNTANPINYKIKVSECVASACSSSAPVTLTEWAFHVTFSASPSLGTPVAAAACASVALCLLIDDSGSIYVASKLKGTTKTQGDFNLAHGRMKTVACASATYCVGANLDGDVFTWSGGSKVLVSGGHSQMNSAASVFAACSSATVCLIDWSGAQGSGGGGGGGGGWYGGSGGSLSGAREVIFNVHSKVSTTFSAPGVATGFSCPQLATSNLSSCAVSDDQGYVSVFNNAQWIARSLTSGTLLTVSCASVLSCVAADSNKNLINFTAASLMKAKERANRMPVVVPGLQCVAAYLCFESTTLGVQVAQWPQFDSSTGLQSASAWTKPQALSSPMIIARSPGNTGGFNAFSSKHRYVGTVTIVK